MLNILKFKRSCCNRLLPFLVISLVDCKWKKSGIDKLDKFVIIELFRLERQQSVSIELQLIKLNRTIGFPIKSDQLKRPISFHFLASDFLLFRLCCFLHQFRPILSVNVILSLSLSLSLSLRLIIDSKNGIANENTTAATPLKTTVTRPSTNFFSSLEHY